MHGTCSKITKEAVKTKFTGPQFDRNCIWGKKKNTK